MSYTNDEVTELLRDSIDIHMHTAPDVHPRSVDDVEAAYQAKRAGMKAILIKSHHTNTSDRAQVASRVTGFQVFGAIALNHAVGGLNYHAVLAAVEMGAKEVWMPTINSVPFIDRSQSVPALAKAIPKGTLGIRVVDESGKVVPELIPIIELISKNNIALGTGHISKEEAKAVVGEARRAGVKKILLTHPTIDFLAYSKDEMKDFVKAGVMIEHDYVICTRQVKDPVPPRHLADMIRSLGPENCVMATDGGQEINPPPVEMFKQFIYEMLRNGIGREEIRVMTSENPSRILGLR
ncbi:MAG: DUF6282 family protein [Candidatus Bathyarchaeia archaeon]